MTRDNTPLWLPPETWPLLQTLASQLVTRKQMLATAESCTGGLISAACTSLSGSSDWFERGFVTYSNAAKCDQLGIPASLIERHGAVSEPVACAMASGAVARSRAQLSVAVTGVAGPTGGSANKPVGTVWFAWCGPTGIQAERILFSGDRATVRGATVLHALQGVLTRLG